MLAVLGCLDVSGSGTTDHLRRGDCEGCKEHNDVGENGGSLHCLFGKEANVVKYMQLCVMLFYRDKWECCC